jgi:hypothetical protein
VSPLAVGIPVAIVAATLLVATIVRLVRLIRGTTLQRVPLIAAQDVTLDASGPVGLAIEAPLLTVLPRGLDFALRNARDGHAVSGRSVAVPIRTTSFDSARVSVHRFDLDTPGTYRLDVDGLAPDEDHARYALVFGRPYGLALPIHIVGIIVFAAMLIGSVVLIALALAGKLPAAG